MDLEQDDHSIEQIKILLKKNLALSEENARMIRSLRNSARLQSFMRFLYLIIIVGGTIWSYQYLKPYIDGAQSAYTSYKTDQAKVQDAIVKYIPR